MSDVVSVTAGKRARAPKPVEPPELGWQEKAREKRERQARKAARWAQRNRRRRAV